MEQNDSAAFELDIEIVERSPKLDDLLNLTSDGCGMTCESACPSTCP